MPFHFPISRRLYLIFVFYSGDFVDSSILLVAFEGGESIVF